MSTVKTKKPTLIKKDDSGEAALLNRFKAFRNGRTLNPAPPNTIDRLWQLCKDARS